MSWAVFTFSHQFFFWGRNKQQSSEEKKERIERFVLWHLRRKHHRWRHSRKSLVLNMKMNKSTVFFMLKKNSPCWNLLHISRFVPACLSPIFLLSLSIFFSFISFFFRTSKFFFASQLFYFLFLHPFFPLRISKYI